MPVHDFLAMSEEELLTRADQCLERAGSALEPGPRGIDEFTRLHLFLEAQSCLAEVLRRQGDRTAERDRKRNEEIAEGDLGLERLVVWLIGAEIVLSIIFGVIGISEGLQQGKILAHMDTSSAATATALTTLVDDQAKSLSILQQEQAQRAKKPRLALYVGNIPLDRASVRLKPRGGSAGTVAEVTLLLKNEGDADIGMFRIHALVPTGVVLESNWIASVPEFEPQPSPRTIRLTLQLLPLPAGETVRIQTAILVSGVSGVNPSFKIPFAFDTLELQAVAPLGSLTILSPKP
jgi:hypothetical protein